MLLVVALIGAVGVGACLFLQGAGRCGGSSGHGNGRDATARRPRSAPWS
jgi:hypothetical protein